MKISEIKQLAQMVSELHLTALELTMDEVHVRIENTPVQPYAALPVQPVAPLSAAEAPSVRSENPGADFSAAHTVPSPMVGVFYASPSPSDPPFAAVGQKVKKGDVLCIIEAMKLMNEITAEMDGEIIDICVTNGSVVEYGQTLFKIL